MRIQHAGFLHLEPQIVAFAGSLAHAREHRNAAMFQSDVVDQLHDDDRLADARAAEQSDLAAAQIGLQQIDHLDAGLEHLQLGGLLFESRRRHDGWTTSCAVLMGPMLSTGSPITFITRPSVWLPTGTSIRMPQAHGLHSAHHAVGGLQRDGAHASFADVLRHFGHHVDGHGRVEAFAGDVHRRVDDGDLVFRETECRWPVRPPGSLCLLLMRMSLPYVAFQTAPLRSRLSSNPKRRRRSQFR